MENIRKRLKQVQFVVSAYNRRRRTEAMSMKSYYRVSIAVIVVRVLNNTDLI